MKATPSGPAAAKPGSRQTPSRSRPGAPGERLPHQRRRRPNRNPRSQGKTEQFNILKMRLHRKLIKSAGPRRMVGSRRPMRGQEVKNNWFRARRPGKHAAELNERQRLINGSWTRPSDLDRWRFCWRIRRSATFWSTVEAEYVERRGRWSIPVGSATTPPDARDRQDLVAVGRRIGAG